MAESTESKPRKTYRGNCHCGAFVFEAELPEITEVAECNCSICSKKGYLWLFVGENDKFTIVKGEDALKDYTFGKAALNHKFCPNCGTGVMATMPSYPPGMQTGINVHAIQGLNTWDLKRTTYDGASRGEPFQPPPHKGDLPSADVENGKLYTGGCHCGAVTLAVKSKPFDETYDDRVIQCNCSICERNGYVWAYPTTDQVVLSGDEAVIGRYTFNNALRAKTFCKVCGVNLTNARNPLTPEEIDALPENVKQHVERTKLRHNVNLRALDGVDVSKLKIENLDGFTAFGTPYKNP